MSMLSIPSYKTDDPNYRYKMPRLVAKVEGRGNGIRTNIVNMGDIARALKRPADYPTKFCGHELGAQSKFDPAEGKAIVNGAHEQRHLQTLIDKFIDKFVLCQNCMLPEIDLQLKKGRVAYHCNACGSQGEVDGTHKLTTFILKNPPESADSTMGVKKKSKEERQREKALKSQQKKEEVGAVESEGEMEKGLTDKKEKKDKRKEDRKEDKSSSTKEKKKSTGISTTSDNPKKQKSHTENPRSDEEKTLDVQHNGEGAKKLKKRKEGKDKNLDELNYASSDGVVGEVTESLINYMTITDTEDSSKRRLNLSLSPTDLADHLRLLQLSQGFGGRSKIFILLDVLFSTSEFGLELNALSLEKYSKYLASVARKTNERDILVALEDFIYLRSGSSVVPEGFKTFPYFLQELYSADVLTEEGILKHYEDSNKDMESEGRESYRTAKAAAVPFLAWLQKTDSESDGEETEDE